MRIKKNAKGFTLVELMIVVAIIAVLAAIALPAFGQQIKRSRDGAAVALMSTFRASLSMVVANLEGQAPSVATFNRVVQGGTVNSAGGAINTVSPAVDRWDRIATFTASNAGNFNAGTPETTNWMYNVNTGTGESGVQFTQANNDTRGRSWNTY